MRYAMSGITVIHDGTNYLVRSIDGSKLLAVRASDKQILSQAGFSSDQSI